MLSCSGPTLLATMGAMLILLASLSIQIVLQVNSTPVESESNDSDTRELVKMVNAPAPGRFGEAAAQSHTLKPLVQSSPAIGIVGIPTRPKPPRGYCVRVSRAVKPTSRCYKHLVHLGPNSSDGNGGADRRHKTIDATTASKSNNNKHIGGGGSGGKRREELVYVRLETLGDKITNLSTQVMNEHVLAGLLAELMTLPETSSEVGGSTTPGSAKKSQSSARGTSDPSGGQSLTWNEQLEQEQGGQEKKGEEEKDEEREEIRAQILAGSSSSAAVAPPLSTSASLSSNACQVAMEKFLCRLVYPTCHFRQSDVGALVRPPCREDCLLLRDSICPNLNWSKFSRTLQRAFNKTLTSTISSIDLIVDGDPSVAAATANSPISLEHFVSKLTAQSEAKAGVDNHNLSPGLEQVNATKGLAGDNEVHGHDDAAAAADSGHLWAPGYNLSSSLHFYWPHEKSIERCESLPPLRSMIAILSPKEGKAVHKASKPVHDEQSKVATSKWIIDRNWRHRPICSNAHLTEIRADAMYGDKLDKKEDEDEKASVDKTIVPVARHSKSHRLDCLGSSYGSDYMGSHNISRSGLSCQSWASQSPHKHKMSELLFDNMREANNYCRNPGGLELQPWCYTMHPGVRWEYCNIEIC